MKWQLFGERASGATEVLERDLDGLLPQSDVAFWASPVGQAARARLRGDRFFQIEVDDATLSEYAESATPAGGGRRARRTCDLLGQIEELGWHLEHVSWWRVDGNGSVHDEPSGQPEPAGEHVRGVYLFHAVPTSDTDGLATVEASSESGHEPTHRRDVL
jgi:hypothetical protein